MASCLILKGTESCLPRPARVNHSPCTAGIHRDGAEQSSSSCLRARLGIKSSMFHFREKILKLRHWKVVSCVEIVLVMNRRAEVDRSLAYSYGLSWWAFCSVLAMFKATMNFWSIVSPWTAIKSWAWRICQSQFYHEKWPSSVFCF